MDKRYQVFVSSTFEDLQEERKEVMQALLELDCIPAGMELFPAANEDQWSLIKRVIDDCDYYILIIGGRYGSTNDKGKSYTQMEYEYAVSTGKPVIAFLHKNPANIPSGKAEQDSENKKKLEEFKKTVKKKLVKYWEGADNLGSVVSRSMIRLIKDNPSEGWVKESSVIDEKSIAEISRLQKENEELKAKIKEITTEAPKGTEKLSQGDDLVTISFTLFGYYNNEHCHLSVKEKYSWNELFKVVAPSLIDECTNTDFHKKLSNYIAQTFKNEQNIKDYSHFSLSSESFGLIKVQFRALGLITSGTKKRSATDKQTYWKLTPYGDNVMNQLLAVRK